MMGGGEPGREGEERRGGLRADNARRARERDSTVPNSLSTKTIEHCPCRIAHSREITEAVSKNEFRTDTANTSSAGARARTETRAVISLDQRPKETAHRALDKYATGSLRYDLLVEPDGVEDLMWVIVPLTLQDRVHLLVRILGRVNLTTTTRKASRIRQVLSRIELREGGRRLTL